MADKVARRMKEASKGFIKEAKKQLPPSDFVHFIRLTVTLRSMTPYSFRQKIKYLFRQHWDIVPSLNPLLPDEYQFSDPELEESAGDYKWLESFQKSIKFLNDLKDTVKSPVTLRCFYDLIKSYTQREINGMELYERAHTLPGVDFKFKLAKCLSEVIGHPVDITPSYIIRLHTPMPKLDEEEKGEVEEVEVEVEVEVEEEEDAGLGVDGVLNNDEFCIKRWEDDNKWELRLKDPSKLYQTDEVTGECLGPMPDDEDLDPTFWCEEKRYELDMLKHTMIKAEEELEIMFQKIRQGKMKARSGLSEYLRDEVVRRRLIPVERLLGRVGRLEKLMMTATEEDFADLLNLVRSVRDTAAGAYLQFNHPQQQQQLLVQRQQQHRRRHKRRRMN